ncbi:MAG: Na+/H+ antiporter NhaC family protein [Fusicatenibacter sp.]
MSNGMIAIIIIMIIIVGAISTRRCTEFLLLGSVLGTIVLYGKDFIGEWLVIVQDVVGDPDNVWLWLVCGLFGSLIALLQASKGTFGFSRIISKICTTQKRTLFTSFIMGIMIFVDDYLNVLSIGVCMKGVFDKRKLPRESLAFVLDSTGAPVCVLLPFSTWAVFYASLFYEQDLISSQFSSGMDAYLHAIPFCFYPMLALIIVALFAAGIFPKLGAMKKAYQRVEETGKVYSDASRKYNHDDRKGYEEDGNIWNFLVPMIILVGIGVATGDILLAVVISLVVCLIMYVPTKLLSMEEFFNLVVSGFGDMLSIFFMLVAAFSLEHVCSAMGLTEYLIEMAKPFLTASLFPAVSFLLLAVLAFVTGSNWGMSAVVIPILIPMCEALGANPVLTMAAIISGGAFGSHACFYTDATVLASNSAGIDNMEHALSQMPYVMIAASVSVVAFGIAGIALPI